MQKANGGRGKTKMDKDVEKERFTLRSSLKDFL
jgi:hypothetical protein